MWSFEELPKPVAFVFSGGVSLGAVQVGTLRAVLEYGIKPDLLIGSSVGALNAAYISQGFTSERVEKLAEIWSGLQRSDVFGSFGIKRIVEIISQPTSISSPKALLHLIAKHVPSTYEALKIRVHIVATDYLSGKTVVFSEGNLWRNLLASSAIPFVFPPIPIGDRYLMDGSVSANVPLLHAQELGARTLVVFDVGYPCEVKELSQNPLERILHVFSIMLHRQPAGMLAALPEDILVLYIPTLCPLPVPAYDFSQGEFLIKTGYEVAKEFLESLCIDTPRVYGRPHSHARTDSETCSAKALEV